MSLLLPPALQATGQALYQTTTFGMGGMLANAVGGVIYQVSGPPSLFVLSAAVGGLAALLGWLSLPRTGERRAPELEGDVILAEPEARAAAP